MHKEWDLSAWHRKFLGASCVFNVNGELNTMFVEDITESLTFYGKLVEKNVYPEGGIRVDNRHFPEYFPIRSRYYKVGDGFVYLERIHSKENFLIGANQTNFTLSRVMGKGAWDTLSLLSEAYRPLEECLTSGGPVSSQVFINFMGEIFFRSVIVASYNGDVIKMQPSKKYLTQEIRDAFPGVYVK